MSQKFLQNHSKVLSNTLSQLDNFYQPIGSKINVYKFRKVSGSIYLTRYGEIPIDTKSETYNQNFQVYTGKEPIVVVWNNSFKAIGDKQTNTITKKYNVGDYETCYLSQAIDISNETTTKNLYGKDYTMTMLKYNISLQSNTWIPSEDDIRDYLYLIFDKKAKTYKWLEIVNIVPIYNEETNNFQYCEINFESINDKYTQTGKSILDFIQFGAIGEGYAFPKETHLANGDIVVEVDEKYIEDLGCNTLQLDFTSGAALSSMFVIGRRKSKKLENGDLQVDAPHLLWLYDTQPPIISKFFYNQPNLNSYIASSWKPTKEGIWKSYKNAYKGNDRIGEYNILNTKEVLTGLKHDQSSVRATNRNINTYTNWEKNKNFNIDFGTQIIYDTNPYCIAENKLTKQCNYIDFLNINSLINFASDVFDYDYKETKKWKLTDTLGILGGIVNIVVGGLDIGWTSSNVLSQVPNDLNLIVPCISYEDGMLALDSSAPLPLDVFYDDKSQKVLPTSTNVLTSWRFRLTDRVIDTSQIREDAPIGKGGNGVWDLKYVGQKKFEDGTYINYNKQPFRLKLSTTYATAPSESDFEFIVDYIDFKAVASCDYRISAYDNANNPVYYSIAETNGKARGDIRIWGNTTKFNYYDKFNTEGEVDYPNYDNPPPPNDSLVGIELEYTQDFSQIFLEEPIFYKVDDNTITSNIKAGYYKILPKPNITINEMKDWYISLYDFYAYQNPSGVSWSLYKNNGQTTSNYKILTNDYYEYQVINWKNQNISKRQEFNDLYVEWKNVKRVQISILGSVIEFDYTKDEPPKIFENINYDVFNKLFPKYMGYSTDKNDAKHYFACAGGYYKGSWSDKKTYNIYTKKTISQIKVSLNKIAQNEGFILEISSICSNLKVCFENVLSLYPESGFIDNALKRPEKWAKPLWNNQFEDSYVDFVKVFYN